MISNSKIEGRCLASNEQLERQSLGELFKSSPAREKVVS
jgi:hypothetical protein